MTFLIIIVPLQIGDTTEQDWQQNHQHHVCARPKITLQQNSPPADDEPRTSLQLASFFVDKP